MRSGRPPGSLLLAVVAVTVLLASPAVAGFLSLPTGPSEKEDEVVVAGNNPGAAPAGVTLLPDLAFQTALETRIAKARSEITLCAYHFAARETPANRPKAVADRLVEAAGRGVKVEVVLEIGLESEAVTRANRETARLLQRQGVTVYADNAGTVVHARFVVIDRRFVFIGSHDLTERSLGQHREVSLLVDSPSLASSLLEQVRSLKPVPYLEAPPRRRAKPNSRSRPSRGR